MRVLSSFPPSHGLSEHRELLTRLDCARDVEDPRAANKWLQVLRISVYLTAVFGAVLWSISGVHALC